jgi:hypothetical protein
MDLDELKQKWAVHDRKLDALLRLNRRLLTAANMNRARSAAHRLVTALAVESVIWFVLIVVLGQFIYDQRNVARFAIPAAFLDLYAIANLIALIQQIVAALAVDYGKPVATIQKRLESLRMMRIRYIQVSFVAGILAWTPSVVVVLKGFLGLDAYHVLDSAWLVANLLFSLAFVALAIGLSRKYGDRMNRSPLIQRLMKDLAGYNLNAAAGFLATLSEFEHEERAE